MKKIINLVVKHSWFLVGFLITLSLLWPLFAANYFSHHDDVQVIRLYEMNKCLEDNQLPCRWVPDLGGVYGYPLFNFYAPLSYYFGWLVYWLSHDLLLSAKAMFALPFVGAYIFMFLLGRKLWGEKGGAISGLFYSLAPYHAVAFYVRGAMGEMWSLMFFPAIFWAIFRLKEAQTIMNIILVSASLGLLILSHNLSTMIFIPVILTWIALLTIFEKNKRFLKYFILSTILGFMLSAFYSFPMIMEKSLVHVETTTSGYFSYTEHFKGLRKIFLDTTWGWGASVREIPGGEKDGMSFQLGWVHTVAWLLALIVAKLLWVKNRKISILIGYLSFLAFFSIFMINPKSEFIWKNIESLKFIQFPWRFLMLVIFFVSVLAGSIALWPTNKFKKIIPVAAIVLLAVFNFSFFRPEKFVSLSAQEMLSGDNWDRLIKRSIFDFLPIYALAPPAELATSRYEVLTGEVEINNFKEGSNWVTFQADVKKHSIIRLSMYYFPQLEVLVDGKPTKIDYENSLGLVTFILGTGNHIIEAKLLDTPIRTFSNIVTLVSIIVFVFLVFISPRKTKNWLFYYLKGLRR